MRKLLLSPAAGMTSVFLAAFAIWAAIGALCWSL